MSAIINALEKALKANPADWQTRLALAEACLQENLDSKALGILDAADGLPDDPGQQIAVASCYYGLDPEKACAILAADPALAEMDPELAQACELTNSETAGPVVPIPLTAPAHPKDDSPLTITSADTVVDDQDDIPEDQPAEPETEPETPAKSEVRSDGFLEINPESYPVPEPAPEPASDPSIPAPPILIAAESPPHDEEYVEEEGAEAHVKELLDEADLIHRKDMRASKLQSLFLTGLVHVAVILLLSLIVISVPRDSPPEIVAVAAPSIEIDTPEKKKVEIPTTKAQPSSASVMPNIINALNTSSMSIPSVKNAPEVDQAVLGSSFRPSLNFGPMGNEGQPMIFGEPIEGTTLGVILDVSGSMAEFLPKVIREIDRNFDKASIVFVNNAMLRTSDGSTTEIRPIATDDVVPVVDGLRTPYWFLWHDLPRKAEQASVDRLIELFKTRQNSYLAVGGNDRVSGAMDYLRSLGIDALYIFSDFQDFVDEDAAVENARKLSKAGIKTYVQPAQTQSEYLEIVSSKIADRTDGKELPPLISLVIPDEEEPAPLLAAGSAPGAVEVEGVNYATPRPDRLGKEWYDYRSPGSNFEIIEVFEHPNFDLVLYGPEARADIFLKSEDGYIMRPIRFWYHSRKWFLNDRGDLTWRRRKWLRNQEPPKLDGNEITWKMVLEDEIEFDVWFVFKDNTFMATYSAELAPEEFENRNDDASITFQIPPLAVQKDDIYYSSDFTQGRNLDQLREAAAPNHTLFNLSTAEADRYETQWDLYGFKRGKNEIPHNVLCRRLPNGILNVVASGPSFGPRVLTVAGRQNDILLNAHGHRADIELWEGYSVRLTRPRDGTRHRLTKTEAFQLTIE
jgi:hypothetical protein